MILPLKESPQNKHVPSTSFINKLNTNVNYSEINKLSASLINDSKIGITSGWLPLISSPRTEILRRYLDATLINVALLSRLMVLLLSWVFCGSLENVILSSCGLNQTNCSPLQTTRFLFYLPSGWLLFYRFLVVHIWISWFVYELVDDFWLYSLLED